MSRWLRPHAACGNCPSNLRGCAHKWTFSGVGSCGSWGHIIRCVGLKECRRLARVAPFQFQEIDGVHFEIRRIWKVHVKIFGLNARNGSVENCEKSLL